MCIVMYYYMCTVLLTVDKGKALQSRQGRLLHILIEFFMGLIAGGDKWTTLKRYLSLIKREICLAFSNKNYRRLSAIRVYPCMFVKSVRQ